MLKIIKSIKEIQEAIFNLETIRKGMNVHASHLCQIINITPAMWSKRMKTGKFTINELSAIFKYLNNIYLLKKNTKIIKEKINN